MLRAMRRGLVSSFCAGVLAVHSPAQQPKELGQVPFLRSLESGLARAGGKPVMLVFQEVPG